MWKAVSDMSGGQIEEMASILMEHCNTKKKDCSLIADCDICRAEALYRAGYRKRSGEGLILTFDGATGYFPKEFIIEAIKTHMKKSDGHWITHHCTNGVKSARGRTITYKTYTCDACDKSNGRRKTKFCPNCGARMK